MWKGLLQEYKTYLPVNNQTPSLSLGEGNTPLVQFERLSEQWGIELYGKYEGLNPTGSFKDRGMVMAVAKAVEKGKTAIMCASTGNTSASAAAYGAKAGIRVFVVIPKGKIAQGKLAQAVMLGAEVIEVDGNFDQALKTVRELTEDSSIELVNSVNPYRLEGQKTAAFEICDQLGSAPDVLAIPVGNAGNISAYWLGFQEYHQAFQTGLPQMHGFQAEGAAPIVRNQVVENPETIATAIRIGNPASWKKATEAAKGSNGAIDMVSDEEIIEAYKVLAKNEGIFAEPGSCASIAGIKKAVANGQIAKGSKVVAVLTGNGLKDPVTAMDVSPSERVVLPHSTEAIKNYLLGKEMVV
ncbi:threonine synthase [Shouchella sp. JSM 1781072]|uniref:threonine synthase n=1 Tax=Bacillaceae TaxID=186817 RepID=UPI000C07F72C|nr:MULTISPECIES: threonine synthase [Bacillaceae]UTR08551.1 threonine synthase [Alkalihalobacillus sp. LMS6]